MSERFKFDVIKSFVNSSEKISVKSIQKHRVNYK